MGWGRLRATPQRCTPVRNPPAPGSAKPTLSSREATLPRRVPADHLLTPPCGEGITFSLPLAGKGRGGGVLMREPSWRSALVSLTGSYLHGWCSWMFPPPSVLLAV